MTRRWMIAGHGGSAATPPMWSCSAGGSVPMSSKQRARGVRHGQQRTLAPRAASGAAGAADVVAVHAEALAAWGVEADAALARGISNAAALCKAASASPH